MKIAYRWLFLFLGGISLSLHAQSAEPPLKQNQLNLLAGYHQAHFKDINFSPLNYQASGIGLSISYQRKTRNGNIFYTGIDFSNSTLSNEVSDFFNSDRYLANLSVGYLKKVSLNHPKLAIHFGGQLNANLDVVFYDGTESVTFTALHSLDFASQLNYRINDRQRLSSRITLPLAGLLVRPPHTGWNKFVSDNEDNLPRIFTTGKLTSLQDFFAFNWRTNYQYDLNNRWTLNAAYQLSYFSTSYINEATIFYNQFSLGITYNF